MGARTGNTTAFFVVQPGPLSLQARLLVASLRRFAPFPLRLTACHPVGSGALSDDTRTFFEAADVTVKTFQPRLWPSYDYPIGNKLDASLIPFDTPYAVFLDSDMLAVRPFRFWPLKDAEVAACPIFGKQCFRAEHRPALEAFVAQHGLNIALGPERLHRNRSSIGVPVYNSGLVFFRTDIGFPKIWAELTEKVLRSRLPEALQRPFADQTALALLVAQKRFAFSEADRSFNQILTRNYAKAKIIHYFRNPDLMTHPETLRLVSDLQKDWAAKGVSLLGEIAEKDLFAFRRLTESLAR